jgi:dolichyl-diphosphooligosaccharide--protein glycosyltransferase
MKAYSTFYILGTIMSMQIPFVGFQPIRTSEHMAAAGTFALIQAYAFLNYLKTKLSKTQFRQFFIFAVVLVAGLVFASVVVLTYAGFIAPWSGRFYSLWDTGYAKIHIPIITSVSEHQPTTWTSFFFDLHVLVCIFPAGVWFCIKELNDERVFSKISYFFDHTDYLSKEIIFILVVLYAIFASYFAGVMVRLILTLTPVVCVLAAIAISK